MKCVWVCLCVYGTIAAAQFLDLLEDDVCKVERGVRWTCKKRDDCSTGGNNQDGGICSFYEDDSLVCCKPKASPPPSGEKSRAMCKKYAEYVYKKSKDWLTGEEIRESTCALVEPLIVGGKNAQPREYPHMALVGYDTGLNRINWFCGGSLISERYVLSAAHCAEIKQRRGSKYAELVRLGEYDQSTTNDNSNGLARSSDYRIEKRIVHPDYKSSEVYNDIALFKLDKDVQGMGEFIRPACLQTEHQFQKTFAIASGWGLTTWKGEKSAILQKVNLTIVSRKQCDDAYQDIIQRSSNIYRGIVDTSMLCTWSRGKDTCKGDSGGPLQIRLKEPYCMYSLIGITSFGVECAKQKPGVYTRISHYVPWIESVVWPN